MAQGPARVQRDQSPGLGAQLELPMGRSSVSDIVILVLRQGRAQTHPCRFTHSEVVPPVSLGLS
jgi:hypothetical protein